MEKGKLKADKVFSMAVRYKQWKAYSNGVLRVMLNEVKQKSFNTRGQFGTFPEITLTSSALDEAMARENAAMGSLFKDLAALPRFSFKLCLFKCFAFCEFGGRAPASRRGGERAFIVRTAQCKCVRCQGADGTSEFGQACSVR